MVSLAGLFPSEVICRVDDRRCAHPIRAATGAAITLGTCLTLIPYSQDPDNVKREIETITGEISGYRPRNDELANVIVYSASAERLRFENADCASVFLGPCAALRLRNGRGACGSRVRRSLSSMVLIDADLAQGSGKNITENITEIECSSELNPMNFGC